MSDADKTALAERRVHELKTLPEFFRAIVGGTKTFEVRRDGRGGYSVGDALRLREWEPSANDCRGDYTGNETERTVSYVMRDAPGFGLVEGFVVLGLRSPAHATGDEVAEQLRLRAMAESCAISVLARLIANYKTDRDEIADSDLDNEQSISITFRGQLGDIRNAEKGLQCFRALRPASPPAVAETWREPFLTVALEDNTDDPHWHAKALELLAAQLGVMNDFYYPLIGAAQTLRTDRWRQAIEAAARVAEQTTFDCHEMSEIDGLIACNAANEMRLKIAERILALTPPRIR